MYGNRLMGIQDPRMRFGGPARTTDPSASLALPAAQIPTRQTIGPSPATQRAAEIPQAPTGGQFQSPSQALFMQYMQNIWRRQAPPGGGMSGGLFQSPILPMLQRPQSTAPAPNNTDVNNPGYVFDWSKYNMGPGGGGGPGM